MDRPQPGAFAWAEGNCFMAFYVTGVNSALDLLAQNGEDKAFRATGFSSMLVGPNGLLGWFFLFAKANSRYTEKEETRMRDVVLIKYESVSVQATPAEMRDIVNELRSDGDIARVVATPNAELGNKKGNYISGAITEKIRSVAQSLANFKMSETMPLKGALAGKQC